MDIRLIWEANYLMVCCVQAMELLYHWKENPNGNENDLTITANMSKYGYRSVAFIVIGIYYSNNAKGTLNMYDGVVLEGNKTNGASIGSGVSIGEWYI